MKQAIRKTIAAAAAAIMTTAVGAAVPYRTTDGVRDELSTCYITPVRILWTTDGVTNAEALLGDFNGQVAVNRGDVCTLDSRGGGKPAVLIDFGKEYQGGIEIAAAMRAGARPVTLRVRYGESVSEAMSGQGSTATNEHAMRDFKIEVPWLGTVRVGESGFRFVRIDLEDEDTVLPLEAVRLVFRYRDIPYLGSFHSDDTRLNDIWNTGAYTVHLNMQNYLWDGIKRDRLVWLGDMHPEVMCINTVFGSQDVVRRSLDFGRDDTPLPGWMNGMCSYSLWWIIIQRDLYLYTGEFEYLKQQHDYLSDLARQVMENIDGSVEKLGGSTRFLDWPTSEMPDVIHAGLQALTLMSMEAAAEMARWLADEPLENECRAAADRLRQYSPPHRDNKQAAALLALAGLLDPAEAARVIKKDGAHGFSTFYGYYMLEALALAGEYQAAMDLISDYWGAMLDLGATTFWEDLDYGDVAGAGRIDSFVPEGTFDIHADGGDYCYVGLRHSLCHGWASGPTPWLSRHVLGIEVLEPGMKKLRIAPRTGRLGAVSGTFPTPYGVLTVEHCQGPDGKITTKYDAPEGIEIITGN